MCKHWFWSKGLSNPNKYTVQRGRARECTARFGCCRNASICRPHPLMRQQQSQSRKCRILMSSENSGHKLHGIRVSSAESEEDQRITRDVTQLPFVHNWGSAYWACQGPLDVFSKHLSFGFETRMLNSTRKTFDRITTLPKWRVMQNRQWHKFFQGWWSISAHLL
jgi:hypothetical protein